jgi:hypothetical protein
MTASSALKNQPSEPSNAPPELIPFPPCTYETISDRHRRVTRMIGFGFSDQTIAEACDLLPRAVGEIRNRPEVQAYIMRLQELARLELIERKDRFDELLLKSIQTYSEILDNENAPPTLKFRVASAVLDRHPDRQFVRA